MPSSSALVAIASDALSAEINPVGAELFALRDAAGRDLLWGGDPAFWTGRAPVLFPIIGELNHGAYRLGGATYHLARHGLVRGRPFTVVHHSAASATLRLTADDETLALYPFDFTLDLTFALQAATLTMTAQISHGGAEPMPASFGFHPAFRWPLPYGADRAAHRIRFERAETAPIRRLTPDGLVRPTRHPSPVVGHDLALSDDLFEDDVVIFDPVASGSLLYGAPDGPQLQIDLHGAPYLGLWTKPGSPYLCIEPWWGIADPEGFEGDLRQKPGIFEVAPGEVAHVAMSVTLISA